MMRYERRNEMRSTIEGETYQQMKQDILDRLAAAMPLDADAVYPENIMQ